MLRLATLSMTICLAMLIGSGSARAGGPPEVESGKQRPVTAPETGAGCGADSYGYLAGKIWSPELLEGFEGRLRVLEKGSVATMDYLPDRLNLRLDDDGRIESLTCG